MLSFIFDDFEVDSFVGPDTSRLWETILDLADGDPVKAQELMQDPEELQRNPAIAALYADDI